MQITLDRSRKFATVHGERVEGDVNRGAYYKQDGFLFDAQAVLIERDLTPEQKAIVEAKKAKLAKIAPSKIEEGEEVEVDSQDEVNLELFLRQNVKYPWHKVTEAVKTRFKVAKSSKRDVVEFLVFEAKLVPFNEVHPALKPQQSTI